MPSPKDKKVHYSSSTKGHKSHRHHNSRDSGVGSSSASDRASLGTSPNEYHFDSTVAEDQRYNLSAVQEALNDALAKIKSLEAEKADLESWLSESNKENRTLKKEKSALFKENNGLADEREDLLNAIDDLNLRLKREASPRTKSPTSSSSALKSERRPSSKKGPDSPRQSQYYHTEERAIPNHGERRFSSTAPPLAPQPPHNPHPNPFTPRPAVTYAAVPPTVSYTPSTVSYSTTPMYAVTPHGAKRSSRVVDDGKYHLQPLD